MIDGLCMSGVCFKGNARCSTKLWAATGMRAQLAARGGRKCRLWDNSISSSQHVHYSHLILDDIFGIAWGSGRKLIRSLGLLYIPAKILPDLIYLWKEWVFEIAKRHKKERQLLQAPRVFAIRLHACVCN